jgi:hypothetical protein
MLRGWTGPGPRDWRTVGVLLASTALARDLDAVVLLRRRRRPEPMARTILQRPLFIDSACPYPPKPGSRATESMKSELWSAHEVHKSLIRALRCDVRSGARHTAHGTLRSGTRHASLGAWRLALFAPALGARAPANGAAGARPPAHGALHTGARHMAHRKWRAASAGRLRILREYARALPALRRASGERGAARGPCARRGRSRGGGMDSRGACTDRRGSRPHRAAREAPAAGAVQADFIRCWQQRP